MVGDVCHRGKIMRVCVRVCVCVCVCVCSLAAVGLRAAAGPVHAAVGSE